MLHLLYSAAMLRLCFAFFLLACSAFAQVTSAEFAARRTRAMDTFGNGLLLVQASNDISLFEPGFQQRPDFYYFTGLGNTPSAILAIDGPRHESWLFLPHKFSGITALATAQQIAPTGKITGIEHVVDWDDLTAFLERRLKDAPVIYTSEYHWAGAETVPPSLSKDNYPDKLLAYWIKTRWPNATVKSGEGQLDQLRIALSPAEIVISRRVGETSAQALLTAIHAVKPRTMQRTVEAAVVSECFRRGADNIAFWPWAMSGANAAFPKPFEAFVDYRSLNREMRSGELVRLDVGCAIDHYRGDVGRTVPVSRHFDDGQREAWNIFIEAYRAGLAIIKDGVTRDDVFNAWQAVARRHLDTAKTPLAQALIGRMLRKEGTQYWEIHGVGLVETEPPHVLREGMVFAFEPIVTADERGFYLEDTILITRDGYENLTPGLPYTAEEIERVMSK
jgi:Xaa-Pro aminopeptidase